MSSYGALRKVWQFSKSSSPHSHAPLKLRHLIPDNQLLTATEKSSSPFCFKMSHVVAHGSNWPQLPGTSHSVLLWMLYWSFATFDANGVLQRIRRWIIQIRIPNHILHFPIVRESDLAVQYIRHGLFCRPSCYVICVSFTLDFMHNLNTWDVLQFKRQIRVTNRNRMPQERERDDLILNRIWNVQNLIKRSSTIRYHNRCELNEDSGNLSECVYSLLMRFASLKVKKIKFCPSTPRKHTGRAQA